MKSSLSLGSFSGIPIGAHWTTGVIAFVMVNTAVTFMLPTAAPGYGGLAYLAVALVMAVVFLGSIIAHELGHSIVAKRNGIGVRSITLFALGGVAALKRDPDTPGASARVALAGPAVSLLLGAGFLGLAAALNSLSAAALSPGTGLMAAAVLWLGLINLSLAVFNMIPALPLDGGRVLQAALWHRSGERHLATITAAKAGRLLGLAMIAFGLWQFLGGDGGLWTAMLGGFVVMSARAEGMRAKLALWHQQQAAQRRMVW